VAVKLRRIETTSARVRGRWWLQLLVLVLQTVASSSEFMYMYSSEQQRATG
jgi:hypothetical protein